MSLSKIESASIADNAVSASKLAPGAAVPSQSGQAGKFLSTDGSSASWLEVTSGMSITSLAYPGNDLAIDITSPGQCTIIGTGFEEGCLVYVDTITNANSAGSITISGTTQITFTPPAKSAASYNLWVVSPTGKLAVLANGIQYSGTPNWTGQSTSLTSGREVSIQLTASGDTPLVYTLVSGTLPTGVTLNSSGLLSGTVTGLEANTTFPNIVIRADDPQNQDASITISLSITVQHNISRSLRFNSADSAYLSRTPASAGNRKTWTWSGWIKLGDLTKSGTSGWNTIFGAYTDNNNRLFAYTRDSTNGNVFQIFNNTGGSTNLQLVSNQVFRDASSWYHFVVALDTTQATSADRCKVYVNGSQITSWATATYPAQNADLFLNNNNVNLIGANYFSGLGLYHDGYMAEVHFVDGQALTPSSFGETNAITGVWSPIAYAGTYGTNGFYLDFSDNSNTTAATLGADASGNGNNWTPNNFSVTAGAGNDSLVDSPTQYGTDSGAGGEVRGNYCTLNPLRQATGAGASLANGNLQFTCISGPTGSQTTFATFGVSTGKWYFEMTVGTTTAYYPGIGVNTDLSLAVTSQSGDTASGYMYLRDGSKYNSGSLTSYGASYTTNDVVGVALDMDAGTITFYKNGASQGQAFSGITGTAVPCIVGLSSAAGYLNFGQRPFAYTAPSGFKALCTTNLPDPTVVQGNNYFDTLLYTGNGTSQSLTGLDFQPDWVWIKERSSTSFNHLYDAVRGATKVLYSSETNAEVTDAQLLQSFDSGGFTVGNNGGVNENTQTYVAWNWNAGGSNATNTDGTITSTVRANPTAGFSVVTYTGNGSAGSTVGHGLGVKPGMIITKCRNTAGGWFVYHAALDSLSGYMQLHSSAAIETSDDEVIYGNGTISVPPTSLVFTIGNWSTINGNGNTFVSYVFAPVSGFSAFGSYTGNGSTDGPFVYTGFRPAWVMIKRTDTTNDWEIQDATRSPFNVSKTVLAANSSNSEASYTSGYEMDILSSGFKLRSAGIVHNASGGTYIYAAFAENPFKYALAR